MHTHTVNSSFLNEVILLPCDEQQHVRTLEQHSNTLRSTGRPLITWVALILSEELRPEAICCSAGMLQKRQLPGVLP